MLPRQQHIAVWLWPFIKHQFLQPGTELSIHFVPIEMRSGDGRYKKILVSPCETEEFIARRRCPYLPRPSTRRSPVSSRLSCIYLSSIGDRLCCSCPPAARSQPCSRDRRRRQRQP